MILVDANLLVYFSSQLALPAKGKQGVAEMRQCGHLAQS